MAYRTWATGETITASLLNAQSPTLCTSATRPTGGNLYEGVLITETDTDRILYYDGTGWIIMAEPIVTWANPITAGITVGNGAWTGEYHRSDGWIDVRGRFTFGTTSSCTGTVTFTLPVNAYDSTITGLMTVRYYRLSTGDVSNGACGGGNTVTLLTQNSAGTYLSATVLGAAVPWAWASGDRIDITGRYQMTTRYS